MEEILTGPEVAQLLTWIEQQKAVSRDEGGAP